MAALAAPYYCACRRSNTTRAASPGSASGDSTPGSLGLVPRVQRRLGRGGHAKGLPGRCSSGEAPAPPTLGQAFSAGRDLDDFALTAAAPEAMEAEPALPSRCSLATLCTWRACGEATQRETPGALKGRLAATRSCTRGVQALGGEEASDRAGVHWSVGSPPPSPNKALPGQACTEPSIAASRRQHEVPAVVGRFEPDGAAAVATAAGALAAEAVGGLTTTPFRLTVEGMELIVGRRPI